MLKIFIANRPQYSEKLLQTVKAEFEEALSKEKSRWYLLYNAGRIVSFMRFDDLPNRASYAGSLNVSPAMRGSGIGSAFMRSTLDFEGEKRKLEAVVYSKNPMLKHYIEDFGFKITETINNFEGTGEIYYKIEREPKVVPIGSARPKARSGRGAASEDWSAQKAA